MEHPAPGREEQPQGQRRAGADGLAQGAEAGRRRDPERDERRQEVGIDVADSVVAGVEHGRDQQQRREQREPGLPAGKAPRAGDGQRQARVGQLAGHDRDEVAELFAEDPRVGEHPDPVLPGREVGEEAAQRSDVAPRDRRMGGRAQRQVGVGRETERQPRRERQEPAQGGARCTERDERVRQQPGSEQPGRLGVQQRYERALRQARG